MTFNDIELDAIAEIINIGVGRAANSLSQITGSRIELTVPSIFVCGTAAFSRRLETIESNLDTAVLQQFQGQVSGRALLAFPEANAFELARLVGDIETNDDEMDEELYGVLEEIGNIVLNAVLGSMGNLLNCSLNYTIPEICTKQTFTQIVNEADLHAQVPETVVLVTDTSFEVASRNIAGSLLLLFETGDFETLLAALTETASV